MEKTLKEESTEAVDVANAFNSINRKVFHHNISILCLAISTYVTNCYATPAQLVVIGGINIRSNEETTQGDPVAMAIYALWELMVMIWSVTTKYDDVKMVVFADDLVHQGD